MITGCRRGGRCENGGWVHMQGHRASLVFLRASGEVITEEHALDYGEDMWESV